MSVFVNDVTDVSVFVNDVTDASVFVSDATDVPSVCQMIVTECVSVCQ